MTSGPVTAPGSWAEPTDGAPALATDVEIARFPTRDGSRHVVLRNPRRDLYLRFRGAPAQFIVSLDGVRTLEEASVLASREGWPIDLSAAASVIEQLDQGGFLHGGEGRATGGQDGGAPGRRRRAWPLAVFPRTLSVSFPGAGRVVDAVYRRGGWRLFTRLSASSLVLVAAAGMAAFAVAAFGRPGLTLTGRLSGSAAGLILALSAVSIVIHELAHGLVVCRSGRKVLGAGFQLYWAHPTFFVNSSDMVMADRRARAMNAAAGPLADAVVAGAFSVAGLALGAHGGSILLRFAGLTYLFVLVNLVPFLELDGYWLLTDLLDLPDLRAQAVRFMRHELPGRVRRWQGLTRLESLLVAFAVGGVVCGGAALVTAGLFWWPVVRALTASLWRLGPVGQGLLAAAGLMGLVSVLSSARAPVQGLFGRLGHAWRSLRFRAQRRWRVDAVRLLMAQPVLVELSGERLNEIAGLVSRHRFRSGQILGISDQPRDALCWLQRGSCQLIERSDDGREVVLEDLRRGSVLPDWLPGGVTSSARRLQAVSDGQLFVLRTEAITPTP